MKKIIPLVFLMAPAISFAQVDFGSPTASAMGGAVTASAKDWEAIGINPANLGYKDNHGFSMSIANVGICLTDNGITFPEIRNFSAPSSSGDSNSPISATQKQQLINALTSPGGLNLSARVNILSFSICIPKIGGLAIGLTDGAFAHVQLGQNAANLISDILGTDFGDTAQVLALAKKDSNYLKLPNQALAGSSGGGYYYRELNIDFGRKIMTIKTHSAPDGGASFENSEYQTKPKKTDTTSNPIEIYGGIGFKPIWGMGGANGPLDGEAWETTILNNMPNSLMDFPFHANGRGYGVDLGLSATYKNWRFGLSATDLGKITWQNVTTYTPVERPNTPAVLVAYQLMDTGFSNVPSYLEKQSVGKNYTTELPSKFRSGISYDIGKSITLSSDFVAPLNSVEGNILNPYFVVGAHIKLFDIIAFSAGYATEKGFGDIVPAGVFLYIGGFEVFVSTNDALAFLSSSTSHVLSGSFGIRLFGF